MGCYEKLALERELRAVRSSLESRDKDVEGLRTEVSRQSGRYDDLWLAHGILLEEARKLCSEVIALRSGVRVEDVGVRPRVRNRSPEHPSFQHGGSSHQSGASSDRNEIFGSWHERA